MKTIKKIEIKPVFVEYIPDFAEMRDHKIYISERFNTSIHKCLCGCGHKVVLPFGDKWWNMERKNGKITISPSIGNYNFPCQSHYIITNNIANFI